MYRTVNRRLDDVSDDVVQKLGAIDTATLSDAMGRAGAMSHTIHGLALGSAVAGRALTVQCPVGDNLMMHKALELARVGDVLVVDTGRSYDIGVMGENMALYATRQGVAGCVIDGSVRDRAALVRMGFPVYCHGVVPRSAQKQALGAVNVPISCGGIVVEPGSVVVADDDGVVVVPPSRADEVAEVAGRRLAMEREQASAVQGRQTPLEILYGGAWVDERIDERAAESFQIPARLE